MALGVSKLVVRFSNKARMRRAEWFRGLFTISPETTILDLGSESGNNIRAVLGSAEFSPSNVYIADIDGAAIEAGRKNHGFVPVLLGENAELPFADGFFDIVYCSSVIEHVTVDKADVWSILDGKRFRESADASQKKFADEIRRVAKGYFVQTPARGFPIESHSWLPFAGQLPRRLLVPLLRATNGFWIKRTIPDFSLLSPAEMQVLFPDSELKHERVFGLTKSVTAVRSL